MTREIDLSKMTNSKEVLAQYRDQLEEEIKDVFIWAISTHGDDENGKKGTQIPYHYTVFTHYLDYILLGSWADFFNL